MEWYVLPTRRGLGTQLRHLIELMDGAVAEEYRRVELDYRPRYFPVMRALLASGPLNVTEIAEMAGITQPAATQTIALMTRDGLLVSRRSPEDSRQKVIVLTQHGLDLLPKLQACWDAVTVAAAGLDAELPHPLSSTLDLAIAALERKPFGKRIEGARQSQAKRRGKRLAGFDGQHRREVTEA